MVEMVVIGVVAFIYEENVLLSVDVAYSTLYEAKSPDVAVSHPMNKRQSLVATLETSCTKNAPDAAGIIVDAVDVAAAFAYGSRTCTFNVFTSKSESNVHAREPGVVNVVHAVELAVECDAASSAIMYCAVLVASPVVEMLTVAVSVSLATPASNVNANVGATLSMMTLLVESVDEPLCDES